MRCPYCDSPATLYEGKARLTVICRHPGCRRVHVNGKLLPPLRPDVNPLELSDEKVEILVEFWEKASQRHWENTK
ncbi:MAG: hypothetical protein KKG95_07965 [Candidatus Omnitrophica bacterium]|nr:hypothetical protein [Candidatus Omnitrophota bacterium]